MKSKQEEGYNNLDWQKHYDEGDLRWDLGEVSPPFMRLWQEGKLRPMKTLVPGCGCGHEVVFFAEKGFEVTGVDFAPGAILHLSKILSKKGLRNFFENF